VSNKNEATEQKWMVKNMVDRRDHFFRVENVVGVGTFDTFYTIMGTSGWIEIKAPREPARPGSKLFASNHKFSQEQKNFALQHTKAGGTCWGFIGTDLRQMLIPAKFIETANDATVDELLAVSAWSRLKYSNSARLDARRLRFVLAKLPYQPEPHEGLK